MTDNPAEFIISHIFDAPRDVVFAAWTDEKQLDQWWGPKGAVITHSAMDFREGGQYHYGMKYEGFDMWGKFNYRTITKPSQLVFTSGFSNKDGGVTRHPMMPTWPMETLTTIDFEEAGADKTKVTVRWLPINANDIEVQTFIVGKPGCVIGWTGTFEQFAAFLAKERKAA